MTLLNILGAAILLFVLLGFFIETIRIVGWKQAVKIWAISIGITIVVFFGAILILL